MTWRSVTAGYPPDGQLVLTKVKRDHFNKFVRFLMRVNGSWLGATGGKIGWHPTHWQGGIVSEPKDAQAARKIIQEWNNPKEITPQQAARRCYGARTSNTTTPAKWVVHQTPPVGVEPFDIQP